MPHPERWLALFHRAAAALPRLSVGTFPTPVGRRQLAGQTVWVKDDSACSPTYGGNKVRKLEFLLADARVRGSNRLVVWGDLESHTVAATALLGRSNAFSVDAIVFPYGKCPHANYEMVIAQLVQAGVEVHRAKNMPAAWLLARWLARGGGRALIPLGGTTPVACVGYGLAAVELAEQIASGACPSPDRIYVAMGTAGTVAGLLVGLAVANVSTRVVAVRTVETIVTPAAKVKRLVSHLVRLLYLPRDVERAAMARLDRIDNAYLGAGYRDVPPEVARAVMIARDDGLQLECSFTGKAMACLLADAANAPDRVHLFWNTHDRMRKDVVGLTVSAVGGDGLRKP